MDKQFTLKLQEWLNTPAEERDYEQGALLLLQLTNNKILYNNISRNLKKYGQFIEFKLKRYLQFRLQDLTHQEVEDMQRQVDTIAQEHALDKPTAQPKVTSSSTQGDSPKSEAEEWRAGKRADHDTLPAEIQALYVENASIMQKMRELHLQLRNLSAQSSTCPDSDRYPFLKEIIALDKKYHQNWQMYDNFAADSAETESADATASVATTDQLKVQPQQNEDESARLEQKNILRQINLAKGRYKKNPSEKTKESILSLYKQLTAPSDALTTELKELGVL